MNVRLMKVPLTSPVTDLSLNITTTTMTESVFPYTSPSRMTLDLPISLRHTSRQTEPSPSLDNPPVPIGLHWSDPP